MTDFARMALLQDPLAPCVKLSNVDLVDAAQEAPVPSDNADAPFAPHRHTYASLSPPVSERSFDDHDEEITPPSSSSLPTEYDARLGSHVQHFRVYGRSDEDGAHVREDTQAGPAFVRVMLPAPSTVWTRGKSAQITWSVLDSSVSTVRIELLEHGCSGITLIAADAPNSGSFAYSRVPWGIPAGPKYFLRFSSPSNPAHFLTTTYFTVETAP